MPGRTDNEEMAVFGGGCFWCTEAVFQNLQGVISVMPGYSGGKKENPTYKEVSSGNTGHIEVIEIKFNPNEIGYKNLLDVFFATHDPTTLNRQGEDRGEQYSSVIFFANYEQRREAENFINQLERERVFKQPIVTRIELFKNFYPAENYHQNYYINNPNKLYCKLIINPKLEKLKKEYAKYLK